MRRRTLLTSLIVAAALLPLGAVAAPAAPSQAAPSPTPTSATPPSAADDSPTVQVYAGNDGIVKDGADLTLSVVVANPGDAAVGGGRVTVAVTRQPISTTAALASFEQSPGTHASRTLGTAVTAGVSSGATATVAALTVPASSVKLPASTPGVFGLTATVTTIDGSTTGVGTLVVPGTHAATVGVSAVMPITVPSSANGLIPAQTLATDTSTTGVLSKELTVAQRNPTLTLGIDPMILASIRVLGQSAPASAQAWLSDLADLQNPTFPLQYGDADPGLQTQAGLKTPLAPLDFTYAMSGTNHSTPLSVGEPEATQTPTATPTPSPTSGPQLPSLSQLLAWPYSLGGIAWPAPGSVRSADLAAFGRSGMPTTIVSGSNTNASTLAGTPDAALPVSGGTALVTDDAVSAAVVATATASGAGQVGIANAALSAQLALAAQNAQNGGVILVSLGRIWPTNAARVSAAVETLLDTSPFSRNSTVRDALSAPPTAGLKLVDKTNAKSRIDTVGELLDLAGESRSGGSPPATTIASFSTALTSPELLTGDVRARLLTLFSVGWAGASDWAAAADKQISSMNSTMSAVQIVSPGSIRQASHQALIPITVTNKLPYPVDIVLRATPSSARLDVANDTEKAIPAGSSAKVLVPVKAQLSNGTVWLGLQLYSKADVRIGDPEGASIVVHADWEGIGALIFGIVVIGFFGFGVVRTIQRRRRERAAQDSSAAAEGAGGDATGAATGAPSADGGAEGGH